MFPPYHLPRMAGFLMRYFYALFLETFTIRLSNIGFVGDVGYELHVDKKNCVSLYNLIMTVGAQYGLKNAGFRALRSLSCEKGKNGPFCLNKTGI